MKAKITYLAMISLSIFCFAGAVQAEEYYTNMQTPGSGYTSSNSQYDSGGKSGHKPEHRPEHRPNPPGPQVHHNEHKKDRNKFSISLNLPIAHETIIVSERGPRHHHNRVPQYNREPQWIGMRAGAPLPGDAVVGGGQSRPPATLFVCRASYRGGMHPGKLYNGYCNIGWGGNEIVMSHYEVLVSRASLGWVSASYGSIPPGAIEGGYHQSGPLFVCQADYNGGVHPGKVVGQNCNFGWGGREISVPYYNVLVR